MLATGTGSVLGLGALVLCVGVGVAVEAVRGCGVNDTGEIGFCVDVGTVGDFESMLCVVGVVLVLPHAERQRNAMRHVASSNVFLQKNFLFIMMMLS